MVEPGGRTARRILGVWVLLTLYLFVRHMMEGPSHHRSQRFNPVPRQCRPSLFAVVWRATGGRGFGLRCVVGRVRPMELYQPAVEEEM